ncbi:MAG: hypothetical protein Q9191_001087 [Dirinaria sp. TL-2023a]
MASKRSRATFEADLPAQSAPYVVYGTPLPPLDPKTHDDGSYVPVWKQEVTDEQGRKRLHGAFTGGFSAGYFNTVGSKEGWTPTTFISSRSNRHKDGAPKQQKAEDFMDDEDIADAEEARKVQTTDAFSGLGSTAGEAARKAPIIDILRTSGETMGVKLLRKMGWREGQGIGPKVRRKARLGEDEQHNAGENQETHLFAPKNSEMIVFVEKNDKKGLGFEGEGHLGQSLLAGQHTNPKTNIAYAEEDELGIGTVAKDGKTKKKPSARSGFGVGILNDNGSDDEDPYHMGPKISFNRTIGADKKKKKPLSSSRTAANPLLNSKPVFVSKKTTAGKMASTFCRCHDGRLPLDGFILSSSLDPLASIISSDNQYPPPKIPTDWKSSKALSTSAPDGVAKNYVSAADVAKASKLSPKSRAALLDEAALPGKSVFDYLSTAARSRIASATNNSNLPPALNEASTFSNKPSSTKSVQSLIPQLDSQTALTALGRGTAGWMPYAEDTAKRSRYRSYLEIRAGLRGADSEVPERAAGHTTDDWVKEMQEFAHAAQIFKPMTGLMASRFTSSSSAPKLASDRPDKASDPSASVEGTDALISKPAEKKKDEAEEAASLGMFGPLTRSVKEWHPTRLLCKRFNVKPPTHVDPGGEPPGFEGASASMPQTHSSALPQKRLELVGKQEISAMMKEANFGRIGTRQTFKVPDTGDSPSEAYQGQVSAAQREEPVMVDPERNDALERERPGEEIFKAVFGSDSEED